MQSLFILTVAVIFVSTAVQGTDITWCCIDSKEKTKCDEMKTAVEGENTTKNVTMNCIQGSSKDDCVKKVVSGGADAMSMDGGEIFENVDKLYPVTAEIYDTTKPELDGASYYAVAYVKKASSFNLSQLKDKKTCHTGAGRSSGWNIPMGYLFSKKIVKWTDDCNQYYSAANFFKESCVPGVKDKVSDDNKVENLCAICNGTGNYKCTSTNHEQYSGYEGAFKCLFYDAGEVAFAKQTTFADTDKNVDVGDATDYELLCKDDSRKAISEYASCNFGKSPAHAVMTSKKDLAKTYSSWLVLVDKAFGVGTSKDFKLYVSSGNGTNLLFKDSTKELKDISDKTAKEYLGNDYIDNSNGLKGCVPSGASGISFNWFLSSLALVAVCILQLF